MKRSLYREYRPQTFDELVGQDHVARTLRNAVETGAVAHAYVFAGPRGTGKTSTARILAKSLNCVGPEGRATEPTPTPCGVCRTAQHRRGHVSGRHRDGRRLQPRRRRCARPARQDRLRAGRRALQGLHHRRGPHVVHPGLQRAAQDAGGAARQRGLRAGHHRAAQDARRPSSRAASASTSGGRRCATSPSCSPASWSARTPVPTTSAADRASTSRRRRWRRSRATRRAAFATPSARWTSSLTYSEGTIGPADVLEALGVTDADLLFEITDIVAEHRTAAALQFVQRLADDGTDYSQFIRDLLRHLRRLFLLQHLEAIGAPTTPRCAPWAKRWSSTNSCSAGCCPRRNSLAAREVVRFIEPWRGPARDPRRAGPAPAARAGAREGHAAATRPRRRGARGAAAPAGRRPCAAAALHAAARPPPARALAARGRRSSRPHTSRRQGRRAAVPARGDRRRARGRQPPRPQHAGRAGCARERPTPRADACRRPSLPRPSSHWSASGAPGTWCCSASRRGSRALYALLRDAQSLSAAGRPPDSEHPVQRCADARPQPGNPELLAAAVEAVARRALGHVSAGGRQRPHDGLHRRPPRPTADVDFTDLIKQANRSSTPNQLPDES